MNKKSFWKKVEEKEVWIPDFVVSPPFGKHVIEETYNCMGPWNLDFLAWTEGYNELVRKWNRIMQAKPSEDRLNLANDYKAFFVTAYNLFRKRVMEDDKYNSEYPKYPYVKEDIENVKNFIERG